MRRLWLLGAWAVLVMGLTGVVFARAETIPTGGTAYAQETLTQTVYLPLIRSTMVQTVYLPLVIRPYKACDVALEGMLLRTADFPLTFERIERSTPPRITEEWAAMGLVDGCAAFHASFLWMLVGELGAVGSMVLRFEDAAGPVLFLESVRAEAEADPLITILPDAPPLGQELVATRQVSGTVVVYGFTWRRGKFVGRVGGGGLVDVGLAAVAPYAGVMAGRME